MRVVSSRSDTSAYAGAISSCGEHACTGALQQAGALLGAERHAVGVGVVPVLGGLARALQVVRAAHAQRASRLRRARAAGPSAPRTASRWRTASGRCGSRRRTRRRPRRTARPSPSSRPPGRRSTAPRRSGRRTARPCATARGAGFPSTLFADVLGVVLDMQFVGQLARQEISSRSPSYSAKPTVNVLMSGFSFARHAAM